MVIGDQSSGKSSVPQAITRLPFPVDDTLCTRFPTEVSLRRSAGAETISAEIRTAPNELIRNSGSDRHGEETIDARSWGGDNTENPIGEEVVHVLQCTSYPFRSRGFAVEFKRMLREVS